ncbi:MAG: alpha/beta hydrolase-fold protein, partial [Pseudomonadales bacterium]
DSPVTGQWATWLHTDLLEALEARYPVRKDPGGRALFGKSSGGFGALHQVLNHGEHWAAAACHSGDM